MQAKRLQTIRRLIDGRLSQRTFELLSSEFETLSQDSAHVLVFFVLQGVCSRIASVLDGQAVSAERFSDVTKGLVEKISMIVDLVEKDAEVSTADLESLIYILYRNLGLFGS